MTDFVRRILRPEHNDWIIRSLLDVDFYKFTMGLFVYRFYRGTNVVYGFINRHLHIPTVLIDEGELREQLDHVLTLRFLSTEIAYLRGMDVYGETMFPKDYMAFLAQLRLTPYVLTRVGNQYKLTFRGSWEVVKFWETIALSIITELLNRKLLRAIAETGSAGATELKILYARATDKLYRKLKRLKERSIRFADFGTRRRWSFLWQQFAIEMACDVMGPLFTGTSNTLLAARNNLVPIGTNAHSLPMTLTALAESDEEKKDAQYEVLCKWQKLFPQQALRILLPDTYGSRQFFNDMPKDLARYVANAWRGGRGDSGVLSEEGKLLIDFFKTHGADPKDKLYVPSDGLDVDLMLEVDGALAGQIGLGNGWGTGFTKDFVDCHPRGDEYAVIDGTALPLTWNQLFAGHSFVCKVESANGHPAVKLSNNVKKATGPKDEIERYLRIFGHEGRVVQDVVH